MALVSSGRAGGASPGARRHPGCPVPAGHVPPTCVTGGSPGGTPRPAPNTGARQMTTPWCHLAHPVPPSSHRVPTITLCHPPRTRGSPRVRSSPGDTLRASRSTSQVTTPKCHVTHPCHHHHPKVLPSPCVTTTMCHPPELACATHVGNSPSDTETLSQQCQPSANPKVPPCPPRATIITLCHLPGAHEGHPDLEAAPLTPRDHTPQHCQPGDSP